MAMTFIGTVSAVIDGEEPVHTLLIAALGCNIAWGLVDAVMSLISTATEKRRSAILLQRLRSAADHPDEGRSLLADLLPEGLASALGAEGVDQVRTLLLKTPEPHARAD